MAPRGRKPKPTYLKVLEGNPGKRKLNKGEPKPRPVAPECPDWLSEDAKAEWRRVAPELERLGLLTRIDMAALAGYCQAYATWKAAQEVIEAKGMVMEVLTERGLYLQQRPEVSIAHKAALLMARFAAEFGLTPSSRGRINLPKEAEEDEMDRLIDGR